MLGLNVQKLVEQEHRLELGLVQTLPPNMVELTVLEMLKKLRTATLTLVQVKIKQFYQNEKNFNPDFNCKLQIEILSDDE